VRSQSKRPIVKRKFDIWPSLQLINVNHTCFPIRSHVSSPQDMCQWHSLKNNIWVVYWSHSDYTLFRLSGVECWLCTGILKALFWVRASHVWASTRLQHPTYNNIELRVLKWFGWSFNNHCIICIYWEVRKLRFTLRASASALSLSMWPSKKYFSHPSFSYELFSNPTDKAELRTASRWEITNSNPLGPIKLSS
jgi:hypothetical protein